jgi:L-asparaginase
MRTLTLITTGGTIEKTYDEETGTLTNRRSVMDQMLRQLRLVDTTIRRVDLLNKDSLDMTQADREAIAAAVRTASAPPCTGVIVCHGTDTLEQTGEHLQRTLRTPGVPVILTGAWRPFEMRESDALQNLTEAIFAAGVLPAGIYAVAHGRALAFPGVHKDRKLGTFTPGTG